MWNVPRQRLTASSTRKATSCVAASTSTPGRRRRAIATETARTRVARIRRRMAAANGFARTVRSAAQTNSVLCAAFARTAASAQMGTRTAEKKHQRKGRRTERAAMKGPPPPPPPRRCTRSCVPRPASRGHPGVESVGVICSSPRRRASSSSPCPRGSCRHPRHRASSPCSGGMQMRLAPVGTTRLSGTLQAYCVSLPQSARCTGLEAGTV